MKKYFAVVLILGLSVLAGAQVSQAGHVVVVLEENHSYSSVIGSSAMPYLNSLATQNALATQYFANTHPSIGNYFMMTTGQIITNDDAFMATISNDNMVRQLLSAGKTWKSYAEGLPSVGYTGGDTGAYARHHNPFSYFSDVVNSSVQKLNLVPFSQFAADLNNGQLPNFSYVIPSKNDDAHDCPAGMSSCTDAQKLSAADNWLQSNIAPLLNNPAFQQDGLLVIVFDEGFDTDTAYGGGHVAMVMAGPKVKKGFKSTGLYQHENLLRTLMDALGVNSYPGNAAFAVDMADMFGSSTTPPPPSPSPSPSGCIAGAVGVTVCSPASGSTVGSPVHFSAAAKSGNPITAMRIYIDGVSAYTIAAASLDTSLPVSSGTHSVFVQAWDTTGAVFKTPVTLNVGSGTPTPTPTSCTASAVGVTVCTPTAGTAVGSPVQVLAAAQGNAPITAMRIYLDYTSAYTVNSSTLNTSLTMGTGTHSLIVQAWDTTGAVYKSTQTITVQ
ncbi:MAG: hypothetical protein DMG65_12310 [Candidatus Angelobacter sp. Gp1-AA117]|nr:MAG: hypothetical protein DMG65_12310 [Candidatus Angelobacter sp. Gp1-AA117]